VPAVFRSPPRSPWLFAFTLAVATASQAAPCWAESGDEGVLTQKPEVALSQVRGAAAEPARPAQGQDPLSRDPAPREITGTDSDRRYVLRNEFEGGVFRLPPGFQVERLFTVPREALGSWVSITFDDKGRLIASDQGNQGLCRITPSAGGDQPTKVERLGVKITAAQGLLSAFGSLYLSVNGGPGSGLYRARDTDGDDRFDKVEKLTDIRGGGEHGPHGLRLSPDGKSILIVCGNHTAPPDPIDASRVPRNWGEDLLLPRQWDANGHARGILAPGGYVARTDPEGKTWEIVSIGARNSYDMAFNAEGELFVSDSDMEWDMGMPWYRPTRVVHATSGSEFGWRSGTGKWPTYYVDSLPPLLNIGPGSPVGVTFGYGTRFPAKYQRALYLCDWTFGTIYALHLEPEGSSYRAVKEEFVSRAPLPLTDAAVGPDGALYFTIGGRGIQSELFRVTYVGKDATEPVDGRDAALADLRTLRRQLEQDHRRADDPARAVTFAWPHLGHEDRFIRYAARVALEHQDVRLWQDRVLEERAPESLITGAVALARQGDRSLQPRLLEALDRLDFAALPEHQQLGLLRAWSLVFIRMGEPDPATAARLAKKLDAFYPARTDAPNRELVNLLVYLKSPTVIAKTIALMKQDRGPSASDFSELLARNPGFGGTIAKMMANQPDAQKLHYAFVLRNLREGWTLPERTFYFQWLQQARQWSGGASFQGFIHNIDKEAFENASDSERLAIESAGAREPYEGKELPKPQGPGQEWTLDQLLALSRGKMRRRDFKNGQRTFAAARCVLCHRFAGEGGATGPDLTQAAGRFGFKDIAEAILEPSKVVSDQYRASVVATESGKVYTGRIVNEAKDVLMILVDPEDATKVVEVPKVEVDEMMPSQASLMPEKLLNALNEDEVLDLFAYLLSRGDQGDPMFRKR
jgi:putative heme-binding domain-containing protein